MRQQPFTSPEEALAHYGVKGMRWGVRNERESGTQSQSSKVGVDPVTAAIGAVYVGIFLASTYVTIRDLRRAKNDSGEDIQKKNADVAWKKKPELSKKMDIDGLYDNVVKQVNPDFPKSGTKMNCRRATFTYEMRRRGYDVTATRSHFATGQDLQGLQSSMTGPKKHYESIWGEKRVAPPNTFAKETPARRSELIFDSLGKYPNGARGELAVGWKFGGGHSMAFEIVNGKPVIFDTQNATTYRDPQSFSKFATITHDAGHTRTDNVTLDEHYLRRWMVNA